MNDKIEVNLRVHANVFITLHDEDDHEEEMDIAIIYDVYEENGKTCVSYYTGNEDCPHDGFYVKESVEEVKELIYEGDRAYMDAMANNEVVPKDEKRVPIDKACDWIRDNWSKHAYVYEGEVGIGMAEFIKEFKKAMED